MTSGNNTTMPCVWPLWMIAVGNASRELLCQPCDAAEYSNSTPCNMDKVLKAQRETNKWVHTEVHLIKFPYGSFNK